MHMLAQYRPQRGMQQVRRRVIALGIQSRVSWHPRGHRAKRDLTLYSTDDSNPLVRLTNVIDVHAPAVPDNFTLVGDLPAGLEIKRPLLEHHRDAAVSQFFFGNDAGLNVQLIVSDKRVLRDSIASPAAGQLVALDRQLARAALFLRHRALRFERRLESRDVHGVTALARHELRQIEREPEGIVKPERIVAADRVRTMRA